MPFGKTTLVNLNRSFISIISEDFESYSILPFDIFFFLSGIANEKVTFLISTLLIWLEGSGPTG